MDQNSHYSAQEILGIINDLYLFQQICDADVVDGDRFLESTKIEEWRKRCALVAWEELFAGYCELLGVHSKEFEKLYETLPEEEQLTLGEFTNAISSFTKKVEKRYGEDFYEYIESKIRFPASYSSKITEIINKDGSKFIEVMALLYPGFIISIDEIALNKNSNYFSLLGFLFFVFGVFGIIMLDNPFLFWGITFASLLLFLIKPKIFPSEVQINKISTLGELLENIRR